MTDASWQQGRDLLVQAVSWTGGQPHLDLVDVAAVTRSCVPLVSTRLAFTVHADERYCTGRYVVVADDDLRLRECPAQRPVASGDQCEQCSATDEFRFLHHIHRGGHVPDNLRKYVSQPHWVYIATFADATSKVGTAAHVRKRARLDEQGAVMATYITCAEDGFTARVHEDSITRALGLSQTKRRSAKIASLIQPRTVGEVESAHHDAVERASTLLSRGPAVLAGESWSPPPEHLGVFPREHTDGGLSEYPHPLTSGEHCLTVHGLIGAAALVTVNNDDSLLLADLGKLKGRRVLPGPVHSPEAATQTTLF